MEKKLAEYQIRLHRRLFKQLLWFYMKKHKHFYEACEEALDAFEWLADFKYKDLYHHFDKQDV